MTEAERDATRRRLQIWEDAQALQLTQALLERRGIVREARDTSGLVEQQALFTRSRRR